MLARTNTELYEAPTGETSLKPYFVLYSVAPSSESGRQAKQLGFHSVTPFIYPPFAALVMRPLTHFSPQVAILLWRCLSGFLVLVSVFLIVATFASGEMRPSFVMAVAGAFAFFPFVQTIGLGQINALILACWAVGIYQASRMRPVCSALFFAIGTLLKLSPVLALGVFVIRRQWKWVISYTLWLAILIGLSVWVCGWRSHVTYIRQVLPSLSCGAPIIENKSLAGLIQSVANGDVVILDSATPKVFPVRPAACALASVLGMILYAGMLLSFYRLHKSHEALGAELAAIALVSLLISPISWRHHFLLALIPLIYLWLPGTKLFRLWQLIALTAATLIIGTPFANYAVLHLHGLAQLFANALEAVAALAVLGLGIPWIPLRRMRDPQLPVQAPS
jgi:alpha-1,2-mannosyltransferase